MNWTWIFVAGVYAAAVAIARRMHAHFPWRIAALFYALVLMFLWQPMTGPYVNLPLDFLANFTPWSGVIHHTYIRNYELNDIVMQMIPWAHQVRTAYHHASFPLWNALSGSGYPLLANGQSAALSPLRLLTLPVPIAYVFTAEAALKMLIAMSFMFALCRRRWSELPSAIGAVCFAFSMFMQVWLHFPHATTAAWLPAAILTLDLLIERASRRRVAGAALVWAAMLLSGHPETAAHIAFIASLFLLWVFLVERPLPARDAMRRIGIIAIAMLLAALIASPFLSMFAEAIRKSQRFQQLEKRPNELSWYRDWPSMILLFEPQFFGHVPEDRTWAPESRAEAITAFAGIIGVGAWLGLLLRAIRGRRRREREMFFVIVTPIIVGIILAVPGLSDLFHLVFKFAANDRLRLMLCWLFAMMTAAILDVALEEGPLFLFAGNAATSAAVLLLIDRIDFPSAAWRDLAMLGVLPSLIVVAVSLLLIVNRARFYATCVLFVAVIVELWTASRGWNPVMPEEMMFPVTPLIRFVQMHAPSNQFRITGLKGMFFPNTQVMYGLADIRAHDPMAYGRYLGVLYALANYDTEAYFARWTNTETKLLNYLNVKYVLTELNMKIDESDRYHLVYEGKDGRVYENREVLPRFFPVRYVILAFTHEQFIRELLKLTAWNDTAVVNVLPVENDRMRNDFLHQPPPTAPGATLQMISASDSDYTMRVRAPRYTLVVSSVPFWPGWHVTINGESTLTRPVNGAFLGYVAPPGESIVRVYYRPTLFYVALVFSILTLAFVTFITRQVNRS